MPKVAACLLLNEHYPFPLIHIEELQSYYWPSIQAMDSSQLAVKLQSFFWLTTNRLTS